MKNKEKKTHVMHLVGGKKLNITSFHSKFISMKMRKGIKFMTITDEEDEDSVIDVMVQLNKILYIRKRKNYNKILMIGIWSFNFILWTYIFLT